MPDYRYAVDADQVPPGQAVPVLIDDHCYAVCNDGGTFYVCDNLCPHAGGSLGRGEVDDGRVICPVHHWPWDLRTGLTAEEMPHMRLRLYPCRVVGGKVFIETPVQGPMQDAAGS
jgi:nitrite reductase/ring-hydroxylating ferredoxin subunit